MEELDLVDLFYMIKRRLWLIIILVILAVGAAYLVTEYLQEPQYYTQAKLMLGKPSDYDSEAISQADIALNRNLIKTYATIAKTDLVLNDVKDALPEELEAELGFMPSVGYLKGTINLSLVNETEVISVSTVGTNPRAMATIVNTFSDVFATRIAEIMKIDNVMILEYAKIPYYPFAPSLKKNVILAAGAAIAIALFIIFLIEMFDHTIKTPEDIEKHLKLPVLGMIPEHE